MATNDPQLTVTFGGWYQRTTLHLSEIYNFLIKGESNLDLTRQDLAGFHKKLNLAAVTREAGNLEFVKAKTKDSIEIRYYEDGLYILELQLGDIQESAKKLQNYFENIFNPAIGYLFSLGAPTPKVLADIKTSHPVVVALTTDKPEIYQIDKKQFGEVYSKISANNITVYKTPSHIFIVSAPSVKTSLTDLVEMQIFFREFKDQLEKYLNIHRTIWEDISKIKERSLIKGSEVEEVRSTLDHYQKMIGLINNRINQMGSYIRTRASLAKQLELEESLVTLFQYKFEVLTDTLDYIKEIWKMTIDYVSQAIQVIVEIQNKIVNASIVSLRTVTTVGVIAGITGYLTSKQLPKFTYAGLVYFVVLILVTMFVNYLIGLFYRGRTYRVTLAEGKKKI